MRKLIPFLFILLLMSNCERKPSELQQLFAECDGYVLAEDTTERWTKALDKAELLMKGNEDVATNGEFWWQKANYDLMRGDGENVTRYLAKSLQLYEKTGTRSRIKEIHLAYCSYFEMLNEPDSMLWYINRGIETQVSETKRQNLIISVSSLKICRLNGPKNKQWWCRTQPLLPHRRNMPSSTHQM